MLLVILVYLSLYRSVDQVTRKDLGRKRDLKRKRKRKSMWGQERLSRKGNARNGFEPECFN